MCKHEWRKANDAKVCVKCGLTATYDGCLFYDKKILKALKTRGGRKK